MKRKVIFRADAGQSIGYGHFIRTLALADMLKNDFDCVFYTQSPTDYQKNELEKVCSFVPLPTDESRFQLFLDDLKGDEIVVLDNYFYTSEYQKTIKGKGCKLVCIDDMHDKHYYADIVINHALTDTNLFDVESYTKLCLGFDYALLRAPFLKPLLNESRNNDLVLCFGGSDVLRIADKVVTFLRNLSVHYNIIVVLGDTACLSEENSKHVTIMRNLSAEQMAELFEKSAAGFMSASTVSIEALSRHLPIIIGYYVDNQKDYCNKLADDARAISVGSFLDLSEEKLASSLEILNSFSASPFNSHEIKNNFICLFKELSSCN